MDENRIRELENEVRDLNRVITGQRHYLSVAAEYKNDDPAKLIEGIQAALRKAAEYEPRRRGRRG